MGEDSKLGFGTRRLVGDIIKNTWNVDDPYSLKLGLNDILFIIQEMMDQEGKGHQDGTKSIKRGHNVFHMFARHLLYRNLANYDSMLLLTSEKGCLTDDTLIEMPRDLIKYPKGVPIKDLVDKGEIYVYSFNIKTKMIELKKSDGVEFVKEDDIYEIELTNGMKVKATGDHPFLLMDGTYCKLEDLKWKKGSCKRYNSDRLRIAIVCLDSDEGIIKKIKHIGKRKVYDVVNVRDNHNFIANGFVCSNTGKSSFAILLAREWCSLLGIRFDPERHLAYSNRDVMNKIDMLNPWEPLVCDESVRFASSADWAKKESKELRKKIAEVRTKHLLFILCFPLKISKVEKNFLDAFTNYWCDLFGRGMGAIYVKDRNPVNDPWRMKDFKNVGSYTEFSSLSDVEKRLKKHPNFWQIVKFPKPPEWLYAKYLKVRERNVYDEDSVRELVTTEDVHRSLLLLALQDIMMNDATLNLNRISIHIKNTYDIPIAKKNIQSILTDAKHLVTKIREEQITQT